jgi:diguanylate cyclase (GGDEF)-like protein
MKDNVTAAAGLANRLNVYRRLTSLPLIRHSYARKFAYAAIVGSQVPLLFFVLFLLVETPDPNHLNSLVVALAFACLAGFLGTLSLVREILVPIEITAEALQEFLNHRKLPNLPTHYKDAAGRLMEGTQYTLVRLDETFRNLEGLSSTDALTGIYNRRAGEQRLAEEVARADRDKEPFEFAFFDMNSFKEINDSLGHAAGDSCIRHVANCLKGSIRAGDWAARWGGDEFVVGLHRGEAPGVFERIANVVATTPCDVGGGRTATLNVSVGVATYRVGQGVAAFVADADRAMYTAKELSHRNGGSNVFHFVEPSPLQTAAAD